MVLRIGPLINHVNTTPYIVFERISTRIKDTHTNSRVEGHIKNIRLVSKQNIVGYVVDPGQFNFRIFIRGRVSTFIAWVSDSKKPTRKRDV